MTPFALYVPEYLTVLEPSVRKDTVDTAKDVRYMALSRLSSSRFAPKGQTTWEMLVGRKYSSSPVKRMAAVIDSTTALRWIMDGTKVLPF